MPVEIRPITAAQARPLRLAILRPGRPASEVVYSGDGDPRTLHLGAFDGDALIGIVTFSPEQNPPTLTGDNVWRLRGMAVNPEARGQGIGKALVQAGMTELHARGGETVWCNARSSGRGFYEQLGFHVVGDEFELPVIGLHRLMTRGLNASE